jgi:glycosyltransferase involved in cell wall biosynthesis
VSRRTAQIISRVGKPKKVLNILTFDTHERYQTQLAKTGHNFYSFQAEQMKSWDERFAPRPPNYYTLPKNTVYNGLDIDIILSQSKHGQYQAARRVQEVLQVPLMCLEHTTPSEGLSQKDFNALASCFSEHNVFITDYSAGQWKCPMQYSVIQHSVDTELFQDNNGVRPNDIISVVNQFKTRDYCCNYSGWERIVEGFNYLLIGDNPGLSEPAANPEVLSTELCSSKIFLNTSTHSPLPTSMLEAMSCGCAIVTTATCGIPEVIQNDVNGFASNDEAELRAKIQELLDDPEKTREMGRAARRTIEENFSESVFVNNWNMAFNTVYRSVK